ncbi:unnamed protein product [Chironomus riparius]|uniref:Uncharacterized protein n=1 Tax=Chironomus riparius TaxID=315576 RepID=A0A9P0ITG7_9DIPT|nr:unnamed protein product [Chironomus riparius]
MTSKSNARMKKFKEKLALPGNEELLNQFVQRKQEADQKYREKKIAENGIEFRKKRNEQSKESKARKALKDRNLNDVVGSKYSSKKGLSKAVKRVERNLPKEREKKVEVFKVVAKNLDLNLLSDKTTAKVSRQRHYFHGVPELVKEFYLLDSVSRQLPGKRDVIALNTKNGTKEYFQKRVLLTSIEDVYSEFISLYPEQKICMAKFFNLRPGYVMLMSQAPHNVCCCIYCENFLYLFTAIKPFLIEDPGNSDGFVSNFLCGREFDCAVGSCEKCHDFNTTLSQLLLPCCIDEPVKWTKWVNVDGYLQKCNLPEKNVKDILIDFAASFEKYKIHRYLIITQHHVIDQLKRSNSESSVILHMDYSENFSVTSQDEIQSAFFKRKQISIFTGVALVGTTDTISFAIVNDDIKHQKEQVYHYIKLIVRHLRSMYPNLDSINFITDGCAAQFKNKYILSSLVHMEAELGLKPKWHFMPTSHGKSAADGIGGILKRQVSHRILSGMFEIHNAKDFVACADTFVKNINVIYASLDEMKDLSDTLKKRWEKIKMMPSTTKLHYFQPVGTKILGAVSSKIEGAKLFTVT